MGIANEGTAKGPTYEGNTNATPKAIPSGWFDPMRCFWRELKAIITMVTSDTTGRAIIATKLESSRRSNRFTRWMSPATRFATISNTTSPPVNNREAFK